jgi:GNAT superfamily N-acetyltransferase
MADLLVKLYTLPAAEPALGRVRAAGLDVRRAIAPERRAVVRWVESEFGERWAGEAETAFATVPAKCHVAVDEAGRPAGFACHDVTFRGFFGPAGVAAERRGQGLGTALLLAALHAMAADGHAYAIIGGSADDEFYSKTVGASPIPDSTPGAYPPTRLS